MVRERMRTVAPGDRVVFDGFPRTVPQAVALDALLSDIGRHVSHVILLDVDRDELVARLSRRGQGRTDDSPEVARRRFDVYQEQTRPVVEHYETRGRLTRVAGVGSVADIHQRIAAALASDNEFANA
jgi:adenylate kinase